MDHGWLLQLNLLPPRNHDTVAASAHRMNRVLYLAVLFPLCRQLADRLHQIILAFDLHAGKYTQHFIIILLFHLNPHLHRTARKIHRLQQCLADILTGNRCFSAHCILQARLFPAHLTDLLQQLCLQRMVIGKKLHPFWNIKFHLLKRELIQHLFEHMQNIFFAELVAVHRHRCHAEFCFKLLYLPLCLLPVRFFRIHKNQEGLSLLFELRNGSFLRLQKILPRQLAERSVARHHKTDRGMFCDHLLRTDLRRLPERNRLLGPRCFHHPLLLIFQISRRVRHQKTDAVDQSQPDRIALPKLQLHGVFRHKFRLHRCDRLSLPA